MDQDKRNHQLALLGMLSEIDRICKKYSIKYMLFAGTALGAVRHRGFIPWDDDLDILMLRPEYEKFLEKAPAELDSQVFFLQKEFSPHWPMFFSKLRKNGTACIERYIPKDYLAHQGIYIDIFPCDNLSDKCISRSFQFLASKIVIAKSLFRRGYLTDSVLKKTIMGASRIIPQRPLWKQVILQKEEESKMVHCFFGGASKYSKSVFPRSWITEIGLLPFEGKEYPVSAYYHELLTALYGNYMEMPPMEKRGCKVHAELVDLNNSYEKYLGVQEKMTFVEYTRSIR